MRPYALRMQPYALIMHFLPASKKLGGSRAESTCKKPYALYAPLLGVGVFSAFFLLRELHTVHTAAYGSRWNRAFALLPVGIGTLPARQNQKCIRRCIRLFGRKPLSTPYRRNIPNRDIGIFASHGPSPESRTGAIQPARDRKNSCPALQRWGLARDA